MNPDREPQTGEYIPGNPPPRSAWRGFNTRIIQVPVARSTFGFGSMLAITISYVHNQSIAWAILHGLLSWFFVIYAALFY